MDNKTLLRKFELYMKRERVADLQRNPYLLAEAETGLPPEHPKTQSAIKKHVKQYNTLNRAGAYIFGDTYEGMPIEDALKIIINEGFTPVGRTPNGAIRFQHQYLGIGSTPRCTPDGKLVAIALDLALSVRPQDVNEQTCCGLGLSDPELIGSTLHGQMDATGGLSAKMFVLKSMVKSDINENSIH